MFDQEALNAFAGGYSISTSGVITLAGSPEFSGSRFSVSMPISLSLKALTKAGDLVRWKGSNDIEFPYQSSRMSNEWFDPIKLLINIAIQRGWKNPPSILAQEDLQFHMGLGYYSAFIETLIQCFSLVNGINLSNAEVMELSSEVQDRIKGSHSSVETLTRLSGRDESIFIYDESQHSFRNEPLRLEPYSLLVISENGIEENEGYSEFRRNFRRFKEQKMLKANPVTLAYPYLSIYNHLSAEEELMGNILDAIDKDDPYAFVSSISKYSQSLGFNLGVISRFQRAISSLLEKYSVDTYIFAVDNYSGSVIVFADSGIQEKISDNIIRDYYNLTNGTINVIRVENKNVTRKERILI
ncbi:MAG: hypothetical protein ACP5UZ_06410 [Thermoplasmata archaeon]